MKRRFWIVLAAMILFSAAGGSLPAQEMSRWTPRGDERWILQSYFTGLASGGLVLDTDRNQAIEPEMVVLPLFSSEWYVTPLSSNQINDFHRRGIRVVCTLVGGYWDRNAPDSDQFTPAMLGRNVWSDSNRRWLDIRNTGVRSLMEARIAHAAAIGCDAIDATYLELWYHNTGFSITYGDQLAYNRFLADTAHAHGLSIGLHNTTQQIHDLVGWYDFAIAEGCLEAGECATYLPFLALNKPVFHLEYERMTWEMHVCNAGRDLGFNTIIKSRDSRFDKSARAC